MAVSSQELERRLDQAAEMCKQLGVRFTELRREILSLILAADTPVGAYYLLDRLKETRKRAAPPTIYRTLEFLKKQGLVHRVGLLNAFIACPEGDQHGRPVQFLICGLCGTVDEVHDPRIVAAIEQAADRRGFQPSVATIEVEGVCCRCRPI
jgi:Fur family zinc uptake transcriptional regulator